MKISKSFYLVPAISLFGWVSIIVASGAGWNPFPYSWNFSNPGAFGDSFGPLSALMASFAAYAAFSTLHEQRAATEAGERRDSERDKMDRNRSFENTFFNFVDLFEKTISSMDIDRGATLNQKVGKDALAHINAKIVQNINREKTNVEELYKICFDRYINDLGHYFRLLYNIIIFIDTSEVDNKYFYVKIIRSFLSESELSLIALNCLYNDEGRSNFKPLVEKYSFLKNISYKMVLRLNIENEFEPSAFTKGTANILAPETTS